MIVLATPFDFGAQLFLEVFGRLLALQYGMYLERPTFPSALTSIEESETGLRFLAPVIVIDGDWPRLRELNLPLPPGFLSRRITGQLQLAGEFRQWQFYQPHRLLIKQDFFGFPPAPCEPNKTVVFTKLFKEGESDAPLRGNYVSG